MNNEERADPKALLRERDDSSQAEMPVTTSAVVSAVTDALGEKVPSDLLRKLAVFSSAAGGPGALARETIMKALDADRACNPKFANLVLEFVATNERAVRNLDMLAHVRDLCQKVIQGASIVERYSLFPGSCAKGIKELKESTGTYVLVRRDTSNNRLRQELLILAKRNKFGDGNTFATYICPEVVCRGSWGIIERTLYCRMHGYRGGRDGRTFRLDLANFEFALGADSSSLLAGLLVGVASEAATPARTMCAAIKLARETSAEFERTLALPDALLRNRYADLNGEMNEMEMPQMLRDAFERFFQLRGDIIQAGSSTADLAKAAPNPSSLILPTVREFVLGRKL